MRVPDVPVRACIALVNALARAAKVQLTAPYTVLRARPDARIAACRESRYHPKEMRLQHWEATMDDDKKEGL